MNIFCSVFTFPPTSVLSFQHLVGLRYPGEDNTGYHQIAGQCWGFSTNMIVIVIVIVRPSCGVNIYRWVFCLRLWGRPVAHTVVWSPCWRGGYSNLNRRSLLPVHIISRHYEGPEPHVTSVVLLRHPLEIYDSLGVCRDIWTVGHCVVHGVTAVQVARGWRQGGVDVVVLEW